VDLKTLGRYKIVGELGRGAMGEVWVAIDPDLDRKVALKLLRTDRNVRAEDRARLAAEARAMLGL
jgi:serine/threonine protein kinase